MSSAGLGMLMGGQAGMNAGNKYWDHQYGRDMQSNAQNYNKMMRDTSISSYANQLEEEGINKRLVATKGSGMNSPGMSGTSSGSNSQSANLAEIQSRSKQNELTEAQTEQTRAVTENKLTENEILRNEVSSSEQNKDVGQVKANYKKSKIGRWLSYWGIGLNDATGGLLQGHMSSNRSRNTKKTIIKHKGKRK